MPAQVKDSSIHDTHDRANREAADAASGTSKQSRHDRKLMQTLTTNIGAGGSAVNNSTQLTQQWWAQLDSADRQRVWDRRHSYLPGDLVESMANAGIPVVSDGRWSCVGVGPTGFTVPVTVEQMLEKLSGVADGGALT
ncbi:MAG: hypothetical protein WAN20_06865 [Pseudonocardiaceae bacterium]|jgi:hypothetical protein|nr:hypothetical protein [Pseudonocardiaceae bacterium]